MAETPLIVHQPEAGETLEHYLRRYSSEEKDRIYEDKNLSKQFSSLLINNEWSDARREESIHCNFENLWEVLKQLNNYRCLLHFIEMLEPVRQDLLDSLQDYDRTISKISKWYMTGQIVSSVLDIASSLSGLFFPDVSGLENGSLAVSTFSAYAGLSCSLLEVTMSSDAFKDVMVKVRTDQQYNGYIRDWYHASAELEREMLKIFPFNLTEEIVEKFTETGEDLFSDTEKLFSVIINAIRKQKFKETEKDEKENSATGAMEKYKQDSLTDEIKDEKKLTENVIHFVQSKNAKELCLTLFLRRQIHKIDELISFMALPLQENSFTFYIWQTVHAITRRNESAYVPLSQLRFGFNAYCIYRGYRLINMSGSHAVHTRQLKTQLQKEMITLRKLADFVKLRSSGLI